MSIITFNADTKEKAIAFFAVVAALMPKASIHGEPEDGGKPLGTSYMSRFYDDYKLLIINIQTGYISGNTKHYSHNGPLLNSLDEVVAAVTTVNELIVPLSSGYKATVTKTSVSISGRVSEFTFADLDAIAKARKELKV